MARAAPGRAPDRRTSARAEPPAAAPRQARGGCGGRERGLEPGDAERRLLEGHLLLVPRVRRVIGGDAVEGAVAQALEEREAVGFGAERRVHLRVRVERANGLVGEAEVVWRHLGGDRDTARLGGADRGDRGSRRHMHDMQRTLLICGEGEIALDHHRLGERRPAGQAELGRHRALVHLPVAGQRRLLLVQRQRAPGDGAVGERVAHHPGGRDRPAVVGERDRAERRQLRHLRQLLPAQPLRDRGHEPGRDDRLLAGELDERAEHRRRVDHRVGVRHAPRCAVAAGGGGRRARWRSSPRPRAPACAGARADPRRREPGPAAPRRRLEPDGSIRANTPSSIVSRKWSSMPSTGSITRPSRTSESPGPSARQSITPPPSARRRAPARSVSRS